MTALCWTFLRIEAFIIVTFILPSGLLQRIDVERCSRASMGFAAANSTASKEDEAIKPLLHTARVQQDAETKNYSGWRLLRLFVPSGDQVAALLEALDASGQVVVLGTLMQRSRVVVEAAVGPHVSLAHMSKTSRNTSHHPPRLQHGRHHNKHRHSGIASEDSVEEAEAGSDRAATGAGGRERRALLEGLLGWETMLEDIGDTLFTSSRRRLTGHELLAWDNYYRYSSIATFARGLAQQHPTVECLEMAYTAEGRPLLALIIATDARQMVRAYRRKVVGARRHHARTGAQQPHNTQDNSPKEERNDKSKKKKNNKNKDVRYVSGDASEERKVVPSERKVVPSERKVVPSERKVVPSETMLKKTSSGKSIGRKNQTSKADTRRSKLEDGRLNKRKSRKKVIEKKNADKWRLRKKRMARRSRKRSNRGAEALSEGIMRAETLRTKPQAAAGRTKPIILIEAGAHAREWTSPAVATYLAQQLADAGKMLLKHVSFIIAPAINPDGYEFSITTDRLWRKNRRPIDTGCIGVDLNRNWETAWDLGAGASEYPCSYIYRGSRAFSEIETRSLANLAITFRKKLKMFVSLHSFGEFVLYPWGYTLDQPAMKTSLRSVAKRMTRLLNKKGTAHFRYGQSSRVMYQASGTADDYMHSLGIPFAYTIELPKDDFILPPQDIIPLAEDLWNTLVCTVGELVGSRDAQKLCRKRIVRTHDKGNKTLMAWVHKKVPLGQAEEIVRKRHAAKRTTMLEGRSVEDRASLKRFSSRVKTSGNNN